MRRRQIVNQVAVPFVGRNPFRYDSVFLAVTSVGDGYFCVEYQIGIQQFVMFAAKHDDFPTRYRVSDKEDPKVIADLMKRQAMDHGATLEAIQLLGQVIRLNRIEEKQMAEAKLAKKTGDAAALKAAAKTAPVAGKKAAPAKAEAPKRKGNPEALAKAREGREAATRMADTKKISVVATENPYREGTKAALTFELIKKVCKGKKNATVGDVKASANPEQHDLGYLRYASRDGHISIED